MATPSRVDLVEIVDNDDDSNITGDDEGEITSTDESEIEDEKEDSQQVSPSACQLKAELSSSMQSFLSANNILFKMCHVNVLFLGIQPVLRGRQTYSIL